jgi:hypothetical protein
VPVHYAKAVKTELIRGMGKDKLERFYVEAFVKSLYIGSTVQKERVGSK